ncbi:hypothetical protein PIB30_055571 [Stylosanthes scabra]|uniref:Transposase MuDR plant domain-containing protein n=1 Tax=Stylosanthes scabra TaxID=79078 RepID=A0ABU6QIL4_9FABA|nr:hypothetical protein [Stylosanthes scabra]
MTFRIKGRLMFNKSAQLRGFRAQPTTRQCWGASGSRNQCEPDVRQVASPSFDFNLHAKAGGNELGNSRSFAELGIAMAATPQPLSPQTFQGVPDPDPHVIEALRLDDSDDERQFREGDNDDGGDPVPPQPPQGGTSSSGTQKYPLHLSNLNLDALSGLARRDGGSSSGAHVSQGSNIPAEFQVGQSFHSKEKAVLAVKNYNICRGVEYRVMEFDHAKYLGKCKEFGKGCTWL